MNKRVLIVSALAAALIVGAFAVWQSGLLRRGGSAADAPLTLYGNVDIRQVQLGFRGSGRIEATFVDEGDSVAAGAALAQLDARPNSDALAAATAQVASLAATLAKLEAGPRPAEIAQARAAHAERRADLHNAQQAYERARQLRPGGAISQSSLDQATAARDMARARADSAREALQLLEEGSRAEDIAAARATLQAAEANRAAAATALDDTRLLSPAAGIILSRVREAGAIVAPSDIVYVLSLTEPVWVRTYIAETLLGRIHPGQAVEVVSDSEPAHPYRGTVGFIAPVAEFTPKSVETPDLRTDLVYRVRIVIDAAGPGLRQGMPVSIRVPARAAREPAP